MARKPGLAQVSIEFPDALKDFFLKQSEKNLRSFQKEIRFHLEKIKRELEAKKS